MTLINFSSYDSSPAPPPPQRSRLRWLLAAAVGLAVVLVAIFALWPDSAHPAQPVPTPSTDPAADLSFAPTRQQGVCLDGLAPTPDGWAQGFGADIRNAVAQMADWEKSPTEPITNGTDSPHPGLKLWVKAVFTNTLSTESQQYTGHSEVPAVSALKVAMPVSPDYNDPAVLIWKRALQQVKDERAAAAKGVEQGVASLDAMQFPPHDSTFSGISACISVLLRDLPSTVDPHTHQANPRSFLIATDCNEPVAPQLDGDFHNDTLYVVQSCVSGDAALCGRYFQQFSDRMQKLHVGQIISIPPDQADQAITTWIKTGTVQS